MIIAVDFDGTIVEHRYPKIGKEIPFAIQTLRTLIKEGHQLILWSVREGALLQEALDWCHERGVDFYAANMDEPVTDTQERNRNYSRKIKADLFIDDRNLGGLPDWGRIYDMIHNGKTWQDYISPRSLALGGGRTAAEKTLVEVLTNTTDNILREKRLAGPYTPLQDVCLGGAFYRSYTTAMQLVTPRAVAMAVRVEMAH